MACMACKLDLFNQVIVAMNNFELPFEKLSGIATDGAPAMVGAQKGLTALVKKEMSRLSLDPSLDPCDENTTVFITL